MPDKGLGFIRNINLSWLDAAADASLRNGDMQAMREELDQYLTREITGSVARRKTIDVLVGVWHKTSLANPGLHSQAQELLLHTPIQERIWFHYGLTLLNYPFFRQTSAVVGQLARTGEPITRLAVKNRLAADIGHLGSLNRAAERIMASLVDWGMLFHEKGNIYRPQLQAIKSDNQEVQCWLLACALTAHPAAQLPFPDLVRLPELFAFKITVTLDTLRANKKFNIQKQGVWDMVGMSTN